MSEIVHVVCPACGTGNRLPALKLDRAPACGRCHRPLFHGQPVQLTDANFRKFLEGTDVPVIVDFWADWCGPCRQFAPIFEQAVKILEPRYRLAKLATDANPQSSAALGIRSIPTLIAFDRGRELSRLTGGRPLRDFIAWARKLPHAA